MKTLFDGLDNHKDPNQRDYCLSVVFGHLGQGKSTFLKQYATWYYQKTKDRKTPRRVLIIDPSKAKGFDEFPEISLADLRYGVLDRDTGKSQKWNKAGIRVARNERDWADPKWFEYLNSHFENGLVILDESVMYVDRDTSRLHPALREFFVSHRNRCIDVLLVSHNFMSIHLSLVKQIRYYYTFLTGDKPDSEAWFKQRTLPVELYKAWNFLNSFYCESLIMKPFLLFDSNRRDRGLTLYTDPAREKDMQFWIKDQKSGQQKLIPYLQVKPLMKNSFLSKTSK